MAMSFDFDVSTDVLDGPGSYQGDLASSYSAALGAYLQTAEGADFAAFLAHDVNGLSTQDALAVRDALLAGDFQLYGLFGAAQSKTGAVDGALITDPTPVLAVGGIEIDLAAMLAGTDTATWQTLTNTGGTIFHTREFYIGSEAPDGYADDWASAAVENQPPTADPIVLQLTEYDEHAQALADPVLEQVDLLSAANADDPDGDALSVVSASVQLAGGGALPTWISYADGVLTIDRNHADLDALHLGENWSIAIEYQITDGNGHTITNSVDLTLTGTADQFTGSADTGGSATSFDTSTWDGSFSFTLAAPTGAFDFAGTASISVTGDIDNNAADDANDEVVGVTLEGGSTVTLGAWGSPPNEEGSANYSTQSTSAGFASADDMVGVTFDANTAGGVNGVDGLSVVAVSVTADYTYWL
jgi:hypothetical protein